ncbi:MAG: hypothetical protein AABW56_00200 [Nanoarchaeota archaeon]
METAEEEAWKENFLHDINDMVGEIIKILNRQLPKDKEFRWWAGLRVFNYQDYAGITLIDMINRDDGPSFSFRPNKPENQKIKWELISFAHPKKGKREVLGIFPVSHRDLYTKKELERVKNSLVTKILDYLNQS